MTARLPRSSRSSRGFTLVELMAVVAITSILALAGVSLFTKNLAASKGTEAVSVILAIRSAEEAYSAENHGYLNVSGAGKDAAAPWYPNTAPNSTRYSWTFKTHVDFANWQRLAPVVDRPVRFGYLVYAGAAGSNVPDLSLASPPTFPKPMTDNWYVIQARGDVNANTVYSQYAASSTSSEVVVENGGE